MNTLSFTWWDLLIHVQHELLLFSTVFFLIGAVDDISVDISWLWLKFTGKISKDFVDRDELAAQPLNRDTALFIPTWNESRVIGDTLAHALQVWSQARLRVYVGCYRNDPDTISAVMQAANDDPRLRLVVLDSMGPSTKADCLNRLYQAMQVDERRGNFSPSMVVFHDAEDMVDPAGLKLLDEAIETADFVQLPVLALPQTESRWLGSHYCEEFAEAHGKSMVVRDAFDVALPAAGVGFAVSTEALDRLAQLHASQMPFATDSLTEDYELGLAVADAGGTCRFVRKHHLDGELIATRAYFPSQLVDVVRQKTRWVHGIAFQGWDRLGWQKRDDQMSVLEGWMRMRDRRGPLTALVLTAAYSLLAVSALIWLLIELGFGDPVAISPLLFILLATNFSAFLWRIVFRFAFTANEFGFVEGIRAVLRIPMANIIAIMASRRALVTYIRSLSGETLVWDKTPHYRHPVRNLPAKQSVRA